MINDEIKKVIIDSNSNLHYAAFYVLGLQKLYKNKIKFSHRPFKSVEDGNKRCLLFILIKNDKEYKVAIDFHDPNTADKNVLSWSDVYAKINYHHSETIENLRKHYGSGDECEANQKKILAIPPSFGINIFTPMQLAGYWAKNLISSDMSFSEKKNLLSGTLRMIIKRKSIDLYKHQTFKQNYIFHISSIWAEDTDYINISRLNFIRASNSIKEVEFEGGLVDVGYKHDYLGDINDAKYSGGKIKLKEYIHKTGSSNVVFNGPSVLKCHGWKLGEYMCLGKAILSTPLHNDLPFPLIHGKHIHFVEDNYESIREGIDYLMKNPEYVRKLEKGALQYWNDYAGPEKVMQRIINFTLANI